MEWSGPIGGSTTSTPESTATEPVERPLPGSSGATLPRTLLILSQVYVPDPASVGQHVGDAAVEMAKRGWRVFVLTARDGYDDPGARYPRRERRDGVEIIRLPWCSFGKRSITIRMLGGLSFVIQAIIRSLALGKINHLLVSTSPPIGSLAGLVIAWLKRAELTYWVMDLNPDQLVALGRIRPTATVVRAFDWLNRRILSRAGGIVVLDRFMAERVNAKLDARHKLTVLPPWPLEDHVRPIAHDANPFRAAHGLAGKFVVMYSGNHGPSNPFSTILAAAARLQDESRLVFMFIGGGVGKAEVEAADLPNVRSLPYQPLQSLRNSLSAADVHLVTVGDAMVGIVHPCKVYGAMAAARPILLLGPEESHVGDLLHRPRIGWAVRHGDVDGAVALLRMLVRKAPEELAEYGARARALIDSELSKEALCGRFCDIIERRH